MIWWMSLMERDIGRESKKLFDGGCLHGSTGPSQAGQYLDLKMKGRQISPLLPCLKHRRNVYGNSTRPFAVSIQILICFPPKVSLKCDITSMIRLPPLEICYLAHADAVKIIAMVKNVISASSLDGNRRVCEPCNEHSPPGCNGMVFGLESDAVQIYCLVAYIAESG